MLKASSAKDKFLIVRNSLQRDDDQTPKNPDIESGSNIYGGNPKSITTHTHRLPGFTMEVFVQLLKTIRGKDYHVNYSDKPNVYRKLMRHLNAVEVTHRKFNFMVIVIELVVFSGLLSALVFSLTLDQLKHRKILHLRIWHYVTMSMMLASGLSVIRFVTFVVSWVSWRLLWVHKHLMYFMRQLKWCVDVTLWFCIVLLGWYVWFRPRLRHVYGELSMVLAHQITRFLIALCIGSFLWLLKNVIYLKLEADLHYGHLFKRIQLSVVYLHGLQIIHNRGTWMFLADNKCKKKLRKKMKKEKEKKIHDEGKVNTDQGMQGTNIWMEVLAMEKESVPVWILRRLSEEYLEQFKLRPLPGNSDITKDDRKILNEAKRLFRQLIIHRIENVDHLDLSDHEIKRDDLKDFKLSEEELDYIFKSKHKEEDEDEEEKKYKKNGSIGSPAEHKTIPYDEFLKWAVRAFKHCWGLERTLCSSKKVFIKLNRILSGFLLMVIVIIWLLLSEIVNTAQLALLFTPFLAASFVFGDSCKKMFEGLTFAFAMHPFDVGDRVIINDTQMRVTELNILTSVFYKYDTGEQVIIPNSTLTTTSIINLDITPDQSDKVEFSVNAHSPLEDVKDLEIKIKKCLDDDIEYSSNNKVVKSEVGNEEMKMTVHFRYLVSYLPAESKAVHKSKILSMIITYRKRMEMNKKEYPPSYQPVIVEIKFNGIFKQKDIEVLRDEILWIIDKCYRPYSKVVMMELKKSKIKMGLYLRDGPYTKEEKERDKDKKAWNEEEKINMDEMKLQAMCERLKRHDGVRGVKIYLSLNDENGEMISQGGVVWGSYQASEVIQTHGSIKSLFKTIASGRVEEDGGEHTNSDLVDQSLGRDPLRWCLQSSPATNSSRESPTQVKKYQKLRKLNN